MIYSSTDFDLIDCEYVERREFVEGFLKKFYDELETADKLRNFAGLSTDDYLAVDAIDDDNLDDTDAFGMRNLTYLHLRTDNDVPTELRTLMDYNSLKAQCDDKHEQLMHAANEVKAKQRERTEDTNGSQQLSRYGVCPQDNCFNFYY